MRYDDRIRRAFAVIAERPRKPRPWHDATSLPWQDEAFSRHFLAVEELPPETAEAEAAFLLAQADGGAMLELGCGGGRTARALLDRRPELDLVGIDVGPAAVNEARRRCPEASFVRADMIRPPFGARLFGMVFCVYGAFLGLRRSEASRLLRTARRMLVPGGALVLEFPSSSFLRSLDGVQEWWVGESSFAGAYPQVGFSENHYLAPSRTYVRRDWVVSLDDFTVAEYGQTNCCYEAEDLRLFLDRAGFTVRSLCGDWDGSAPTDGSQRCIAVGIAKD